MESWLQFFLMTGGLALLGGFIWLGGREDDRRWRLQKDAEEVARRAAAE